MCFNAHIIKGLGPITDSFVWVLAIQQIHLFEGATVGLYRGGPGYIVDGVTELQRGRPRRGQE